MLIDLPESAVQIINERAEMQGVSVAELIMQTFDNKPQKITPLAQRIHERFNGLYENNDEFDFEQFLPTRNHYAKGLEL